MRYSKAGCSSMDYDGTQIFLMGDALLTVPVRTGKGVLTAMKTSCKLIFELLPLFLNDMTKIQQFHNKYRIFVANLLPPRRVRTSEEEEEEETNGQENDDK